MAPLGVVTQHLLSLVEKQVDEYSLIVWYDPDHNYGDVVRDLQLPDTVVMRYEGSFIRLRWQIDQEKLMDGEEPPRMIVYVPLAQDQTHHALIELEVAGIVLQPGQQPPSRNTRLAIVARNALRDIVGNETAAQVEKQTESGKLSLTDLNALADKGGEISKGVVSLIFGTGNPQEVTLAFLDRDQFDGDINHKDASGELYGLLSSEFGFDAPKEQGLDKIRQKLSRHVLMTELIHGLGDVAPSKLKSVVIASTPTTIESCNTLAKLWRLRRDTRDSYILAAQQIESEYALFNITFDPNVIVGIDTFSCIEWALLANSEERLLEKTDGEILTLSESRLTRFWCDVEPRLQTRWALVASVCDVLLEADRVQGALKSTPTTTTSMIQDYAKGPEPWCLLDTCHRHMESRWHRFEAYGDNHERIEKLVIKARQRYTAVGSVMAKQFLEMLVENELPPEISRQRESFEKLVKPCLGKKKTAYIWVDSFRFEMARELSRLLREDFEVELDVAFAAVPTITEIGMAALLPGAQTDAKVVTVGGGKLALEINGEVIKDRRARVAYLKKHVDVSVYDTKLDNLLPKPSKKVRDGIDEAQLLIVTSQEIDELCEQGNITQARRQMDGVLNDLRRGIRILADYGIENVFLIADHGHLFADELSDDMKISPPGGETVDLHRRVWIGNGGSFDDAYLRAPLSTFGMRSEYDLATPWTFACFKSKGGGKAYFHGGLSLQEVLVPVMSLQSLTKLAPGPPAGIEWKLILGSDKLSTRFFSVQISGINTGLFDVAPPRVRIEIRAKGKTVSRSVSASYGFDEATGDVAMRNAEADEKTVDSNTVTIMITDELEQKSVALFLFDASTGVELARVEAIEVAIGL